MSVDVGFYRAYYKDLSFMSEADALVHWEEFGRAEGRFSGLDAFVDHARGEGWLPADFDPHRYLLMNPDLPRFNSTVEILQHYIMDGRFESRPYREDRNRPGSAAAAVLDVDFYRAYYTDMHGRSRKQAKRHFETIGSAEGRYGNQAAFLADVEPEAFALPDDFDGKTYLDLNPELRPCLKQPWDPAYHYLRYGRSEGRSYRRERIVYDKARLNATLSSVYDMPDVIIDAKRPATINMLVPAFDFGSMSAGFFGVFQTALFVQSCGFNVRLVMYDRFDFNEAYMREKLGDYPGLEHLLDRVEVAYIGNRRQPLRVSPHDNCIATVWYSAYLAQKISRLVLNKKFLYLIQDYETVFYASSSLYALADATYSFDYVALFSTKALQTFFFEKEIGRCKGVGPRHTFFNNACSRSLPKRSEFMARKRKSGVKRLAFYSRPIVNRNMFELGALALCEAVEQGLFDDGSWEFYGIGLGDATIKLSDTVSMTQLPRMNLRDYQKLISSFDVGLCLMASSHPSLLPFDLAGSGAVVVTNLFGVKDQDYFDALVPGVVTTEPDVVSLVDALRRAAERVDDLETRYAQAAAMTFPTTWKETWQPHHQTFVHDVFAGTPRRSTVTLRDRAARFVHRCGFGHVGEPSLAR